MGILHEHELACYILLASIQAIRKLPFKHNIHIKRRMYFKIYTVN
jgi:hypothetical protein